MVPAHAIQRLTRSRGCGRYGATVGFTVSRTGVPEQIIVLSSDTSLFDRNAYELVKRFRYPSVPQACRWRERIEFDLDDLGYC